MEEKLECGDAPYAAGAGRGPAADAGGAVDPAASCGDRGGSKCHEGAGARGGEAQAETGALEPGNGSPL